MTQLSLELESSLDYQLVVSPRAKRLSLRVEAGRGVVVTTPKRYPRRDIPGFVEANRAWIEQALDDIERRTPPEYRVWPPQRLHLNAISKTVLISFGAENAPDGHKDDRTDTFENLNLSADSGDKVAVATEIAHYLKVLARQVLPRALENHAREKGVQYKRVQIRGQRSVWGSYSSSGTLSLNYKLLFLPPELVDYVLLHELAHTLYLDHSSKFWRQLEVFQPGAQALDKRLSAAGRDVPPWLEWAL